MKPYFQTELGKLYCGDCLDIMPQLDQKFDLCLTDIPYNEVNRNSNGLRNLNKGNADICNFCLEGFVLKLKNMITTGSFYIFCGLGQFSTIYNLLRQDLSSRCIVFEKNNPSPLNAQHLWVSGIELCYFGKYADGTYNGGYHNSILRYNAGTSKSHPTQKPLKLFEFLIYKSSNANQLVLDPFLGSGTTAVACENLNRRWAGIEREEK